LHEEQLNIFKIAKHPKQSFNYIKIAVKSLKKTTFFTTAAMWRKSSVHSLNDMHYVVWEDHLTTWVQWETYRILFPVYTLYTRTSYVCMHLELGHLELTWVQLAMCLH